MSSVVIISDAEFETEVMKAAEPVLVYFWAAWCGPCRLTAPIVDRLAASHGDRLKVVKMEVDPNPESVARYKIEGVPAFRLIQDGKLLESSEGAINQQKLETLLAPHL